MLVHLSIFEHVSTEWGFNHPKVAKKNMAKGFAPKNVWWFLVVNKPYLIRRVTPKWGLEGSP